MDHLQHSPKPEASKRPPSLEQLEPKASRGLRDRRSALCPALHLRKRPKAGQSFQHAARKAQDTDIGQHLQMKVSDVPVTDIGFLLQCRVVATSQRLSPSW